MTEPTNSSQGAPAYAGAPWAFRRAVSQGKQLVQPWWGMGDVVITFIGAGVVSLIASILLVRSHIDPVNSWGLLISTSAPWIMLAGWPIYATWRKGNGARIDLGLQATPAHMRLGFLAGVIAITLGGAIGAIQQSISGPITSVAGDLAVNQSGIVLFIFLLMIMFGAPIIEEIAFRGLLFGALMKSQLSGVASVFLSALVFSLFHFETSRILILLAIGLVLGEVRRRTGSTLAAMAAHFVVNAPAAIAILLSALGIGPALN